MKQKIVLTVLLAAVLAGCSKEDGRMPLGPETEDPLYENYVISYVRPAGLFILATPDQETVTTDGDNPFQITLMLHPSTEETYSGGVKYNYTQVNQYCNENCAYPSLEDHQFNPEARRVFDSLSTAHKDTKYLQSSGIFLHVTVYRRMKLDVISDAPYDAAHPAGSSLADIITVRFPSAKEFIEDGYRWTDATKNLPHENLNVLDGIILIKSLTQFNTEYRKLMGDWFRMTFTKAPDATSTHRLTIVYRDEDGRVLTSQMEPVTIRND